MSMLKRRIALVAVAVLLALLVSLCLSVAVRSDPLPDAAYMTDGSCGPGTCLVKCCGDCPLPYYEIPASVCGFYFVDLDAPAPFAQSWRVSAPFTPDAVFGTVDEPVEVCLGYVERGQIAACLGFDYDNPYPHRVEVVVQDDGILARAVLPARNEPSFSQFLIPHDGRLCLLGNASSLWRCEVWDEPLPEVPTTGFDDEEWPHRVFVALVLR